jgi:hypothetical protein
MDSSSGEKRIVKSMDGDLEQNYLEQGIKKREKH